MVVGLVGCLVLVSFWIVFRLGYFFFFFVWFFFFWWLFLLLFKIFFCWLFFRSGLPFFKCWLVDLCWLRFALFRREGEVPIQSKAPPTLMHSLAVHRMGPYL